jgi:adenylate cyclase
MEHLGQGLHLFEGYSLDLTRGSFRGADGEIELRPKTFELLRYLVENAGRLLPKDELVNAVWPNVIVSDDSLAQCVSELRHALNDPDRRIIKTMPRRGYLFAVPVAVRPRDSVGQAGPSNGADNENSGLMIPAQESEEQGRVTATRRLAAILAADMVGYSRLIGNDEHGTLQAFKAIQAELFDPKIAEHHGRLVKTTGDGLLVEFSSVVDALRCAGELQARLAERNATIPTDERIEFRIGINVGDIVVENGDIFGDGVSIAVRLEGLADPGGICVSSRVQEDAVGKINLIFEDLGEQQLKNISRRIRVFRVLVGSAGLPTAAVDAEVPLPKPALPLPDKPSLAVLPFENMTGDKEQDYFVDGTVEEIITAISRLPWLFVIARNSSFTYKGRAVDVRQVARELGVRYLLEGSVRKAGPRVRISGQLIDTTTRAHIWADRFDGAIDDIFALQDQVASSVVGAIEPRLRLSEIERATRKSTESLDAYDLYLRALAQLHKHTEEGMRGAVAMLLQALAIDPSCAPAAALIGLCRVYQKSHNWGPVSDAEVTEATHLAIWAIEAGKDDPDALWMAADTLASLGGDRAVAASAADRALALNPNSAHAWMTRGWVFCFQRQSAAAIEALQRAIRLSPLDPLGYLMFGGIALAHFLAGRYEEASEWAGRSLHEQPRFTGQIRVKLAACGHLGRADEARQWLRRLLEFFPGLTLAAWKANAIRSGMPPETLAAYEIGLFKAGLPEN